MSFSWTEFYSGDELRFDYQNTLYPSSEWTLTVHFIGLVTGSVNASSLDSTSFQVTASSALTSTFASGSYIVYFSVNRGTERHIVEKTSVTVLPNPATTPLYGYDARSHVRRVYDSICSVIEGRATEKDLAVTIGGRSLQKVPLKDLVAMYYQYKELVRQEELTEKINKGEYTGTKIQARFV